MEDADDAAASVAAGIRPLVGPLHASDPQRAHEDGQGAPTRPAVLVFARPRHSQGTPGEGTGLSAALSHAQPLRYRGSARLPRVVESSQHPLLRPTWLRRARADPVRRPGSGAHADVARPSLTIDHRPLLSAVVAEHAVLLGSGWIVRTRWVPGEGFEPPCSRRSRRV